MPELGEVAHAVSLLRTHLLGKTIKNVNAAADDLLFVKPLTGPLFSAATLGKQVTQVGRQGKYFMVELEGAKTLVLHFGMTGWIYVRDVGALIRMEGGGDRKVKEMAAQLESEGKDASKVVEHSAQWPPKFTKFTLDTDAGDELAFVDPRRLARIRLLDCALDKAHDLEPLSKLGTDFSQTQPPAAEVVPLILKRKVPVKSLLLDQTLFSGIGNWMADEILYQARLHPEQYADTLGQDHASNLYAKLLEVSTVAAETLGNSAAFPKHWLMLHRWGKARSKKEVQKTAEGHVVSFVTVGGRTSCYVPDLQKKLPKSAKAASDENGAQDGVKDEVKDEENAKDGTKDEVKDEAKAGAPTSRRKRVKTK